MSAPFTIVTLVDEDGDEYPVRLPGVFRANRAADAEAALQILRSESEHLHPRGEVKLGDVEYFGASA